MCSGTHRLAHQVKFDDPADLHRELENLSHGTSRAGRRRPLPPVPAQGTRCETGSWKPLQSKCRLARRTGNPKTSLSTRKCKNIPVLTTIRPRLIDGGQSWGFASDRSRSLDPLPADDDHPDGRLILDLWGRHRRPAAILHVTVLPAALPLPGTKPLTMTGDIADAMVAGVDRFLLRQTEQSTARRAAYWKRDFRSAAAYNASVEPNRKRLAHILGVRDPRVPLAGPQLVGTIARPDLLATCSNLQRLRRSLAGIRRRERRGFAAGARRWHGDLRRGGHSRRRPVARAARGPGSRSAG